MRKVTSIGLCSAPVAWLCLQELETRLLDAGVLNTKDMTFVGDETGTPWEYAMNIWHWDAALGILMLVAGLCAIVGTMGLLAGSKRRQSDANAGMACSRPPRP